MGYAQPTPKPDVIDEYTNLANLVRACEEFYRSSLMGRSHRYLETRQQLSDWIRKFHRECGTLTPQVEQALQRLQKEDCLLLMTAHQPNLFAYAGVLRKATLNRVLADRISESLDVRVVTFFGLADQDFADDRWVRSALLPDSEKRNGVLELRVALPEKMLLNRIPKPAHIVLDKWEQEVHDWIHRKTKAVTALVKELGVQLGPVPTAEYSENLKQFWSIVVEAYDRARTYADFNAFVISRVINDTWGYDTLFCRFSECQRIFKREFGLLTREFRKYSQALLDEVVTSPSEEKGVYNDECYTIPVWYHCDCGSKARLAATEIGLNIRGRGICLRCGKEYEIDFSQDSGIWTDLHRVSARALTMPLVFFNGLGVTCYVGGIGGRQYLRQAKHVADRMGMSFPPIAIWRPHDRYLGLGQLEALLTIKKLAGSFDPPQCKAAETALREKLATMQRRIEELETRKKEIANSTVEGSEKINMIKDLAKQQGTIRRETNSAILARHLGLLENSEQIMSLYPCIIDYAVNVGLRHASERWEEYLKTVGDLSSDITFKTRMDRKLSQLGLQPPWTGLAEDFKYDRLS
jgi:hypothetical protein